MDLELPHLAGRAQDPGLEEGIRLRPLDTAAEVLRRVRERVPLPGQGRQISFLPAAHVADRWTSHYSAFMTYANTLMCVEDMTAVPPAVAQTRPTVFGAVPRVWEKFTAALEAGYSGDLLDDARRDPAIGEALRVKLGPDEADWMVTGAAPTPTMGRSWWAAPR